MLKFFVEFFPVEFEVLNFVEILQSLDLEFVVIDIVISGRYCQKMSPCYLVETDDSDETKGRSSYAEWWTC